MSTTGRKRRLEEDEVLEPLEIRRRRNCTGNCREDSRESFDELLPDTFAFNEGIVDAVKEIAIAIDLQNCFLKSWKFSSSVFWT